MTDLQQGAPSAPPAGWYPDPVRPGATRYWSGTGWTDQVNSPIAEPALVPLGATFDAGPVGAPAVAPFDPTFDVGRVVEPSSVTFGAPPPPRENHATQSEWHQTSARPLQRVGVTPVSVGTRPASSAARNDPYDRNWMAGVAFVVALASIPGIAARMLWDLPPLTQSIFAGAPIGLALLAFARGARTRRGLVLSIIAVVISAASLVAAWVLDPAFVRGIADSIVALLPA